MHRFARQVASSRLPPRIPRVSHPKNLCRTSFRNGYALHRYYSTPTSSSSSGHDEFHRLLASIRPGVPEEQLAHSIVSLLAKTKDKSRLERLEALVSLYAMDLDPTTLSESVSGYLERLPHQQPVSSEEEIDNIVGEIDTLSAGAGKDGGVKDSILTELLDRAETEVAARPKLTEDTLARAIVSLARSTSLSSGYGKVDEKETMVRERVGELMDLFVRAAQNAELASEGVMTTPLFGEVKGKGKDKAADVDEGDESEDKIDRFVPYEEREVYDEDVHEALGEKLDTLFEDPTVDNPKIKSIVEEFTNENGELDQEVAEALKAFGFPTPSTKTTATTKTATTKTTQGSSEFSFEQAMAQTTRESKEAEDMDTAALTSGKDQPQAFETFPDLMTPDPLMDSRDVREFPPDHESPYHNRVVVRNHSSIFHEQMAFEGQDLESDDLDWKPEETDETEEEQSSNVNLPLGQDALNRLYRFPIFSRRVTQQTGKGKIHRIYSMVIVGNGDGLVGYGEGKDEDSSRAEAKAFSEAVRNMDWVERFEKRTVWTEMETKLGATRIILRPRPVGFGLRCNPNLHQVLKAAGIKDISAKVWGSRNPINVIKAAFRMLQAGNAPLAMGDGVGGKGRKLNKGSGARGKGEVERERGRRLVSLRK